MFKGSYVGFRGFGLGFLRFTGIFLGIIWLCWSHIRALNKTGNLILESNRTVNEQLRGNEVTQRGIGL